jgi:acetyl-CoA acetyltransferase
MVYVIVLVLLFGIVWLVGGPILRPGSRAGISDQLDDVELKRSERRIDLEAARDAKFREIRDAELDHQTGKLSEEDFGAIDGTLRAQAIELIHELDAIEALDAESASARQAAADEEPTASEPE